MNSLANSQTRGNTQSTYKCRVQSCVWLASSKILTPHTPLHLASVSSPRTKSGGVHTLAGRWGVSILEDARHWIVLLQYNLSTGLLHRFIVCVFLILVKLSLFSLATERFRIIQLPGAPPPPRNMQFL